LVDGARDPVDELGQATRQLDASTADVVERQHATEEAFCLLRHRHADEDAGDAGVPGIRAEFLEVKRSPVLGVDTPADTGGDHPSRDGGEIVVVEAEHPADRRSRRQVEDFGCRHPPAGQLEQARDDSEQRVHLSYRPIGQPHLQVRVLGVRCGRRVALRIEHGVDQRGVSLDVRAHDQNVTRFEVLVLLKQMEDRVTQDLDLSGSAVAGVDLDAAIGLVENDAPVRISTDRRSDSGLIATDGALHVFEQG
jgi:hypothetical protein